MQGQVKAHISWEDLSGQDQDGKGKNKASNVPYGTAAQQSGIRLWVCESSSLPEVSTILLMTPSTQSHSYLHLVYRIAFRRISSLICTESPESHRP